jgi:DNA-directed RNA polymerase subunit beta
MQRQAVPLLVPEAATVGTGIEGVARDSSQLIVAEAAGEVVRADGDVVEVKYKDGVKKYELDTLCEKQ